MNDEKLIALVREYEEFYNLSHSEYLNGKLKERKWAEIATKLKQPVALCKARWNNIRDNFRKSLKKRGTKSEQAATRINKYKYEDQLSFLVPFIKTDSAKKTTDDENANSNVEENDDIEGTDLNKAGNSNQNIDKYITISDVPTSPLQLKRKKRAEDMISELESPETASVTLMRYAQQRNEKIVQQSVHPVDAFLAGLAPTLKSLSPYHLNIAKSKIFHIIQELEMDEIMHVQHIYTTPTETTSSPSSGPSPSYCASPLPISVTATSPALVNSEHIWPSQYSNSQLNSTKLEIQ